MKTPIQTPRKQQQQRNPRNSSTPLKRTANLLHHESTDIVSESRSPMMISPVMEEIKVTSSEIESIEILDCDLLGSPTADESLVFDTDSSLSASSEITSYTVNSTQAKSDECEISTAMDIFKFADASTLSASSEVINSSENASPNESTESEAISSHSKKKTENKDSEIMMMEELLKRSGIDSNRLKSLLKIGGTNLEDDLSDLMCGKVRIGIFYFVIWIGLVLVILLWKSSSSGVSISLTPPPT